MVLSICHTFSNVNEVSATGTSSSVVDCGPIRWFIKIKLITNNINLHQCFEISLAAEPRFATKDDIGPFRIEANTRIRINGKCIRLCGITQKIKDITFYKNKSGTSCYEVALVRDWLTTFKEEYFTNQNTMTIHAEIDLLRIEGIRNCHLNNFFDSEIEGSDLILNVGNLECCEPFYLHTQILSLNSAYFKRLINIHKIEETKKQYTKKGLRGKKEKLQITVALPQPFSNYLLQTYFNMLYNFQEGLIHEENVRDLVDLANIWESKTIWNYIEAFLLSNLNSEGLPIELVIINSWKNSLKTLKLVVLRNINIEIFAKLSKMDEYQLLPVDIKADLTEQLLKQCVYTPPPPPPIEKRRLRRRK